MKKASGIDGSRDWGSEKVYLHSTRQNLWNNDYYEFLVKCVWKIDKPVKIIDFGCAMPCDFLWL